MSENKHIYVKDIKLDAEYSYDKNRNKVYNTKKLRRHFEEIKEVITAIRSIRKEKNIAPKEALKLMVRSSEGSKYREYLESVIIKLANLSAVAFMLLGGAIWTYQAGAINGEHHWQILQGDIMNELIIGALQECGINGDHGF